MCNKLQKLKFRKIPIPFFEKDGRIGSTRTKAGCQNIRMMFRDVKESRKLARRPVGYDVKDEHGWVRG
ncbi:hypothetical protein C4K68_08765 [Pokkaliibacter plantistimulans]|uniref:Uncharacterized protein n=1 Tax=Proteobacteria bacterium 228 TaxID=2083153 RepID=A0A2S5KSB5_9PROT|nr:hypothetical protein C4K68_08765 [Pokkaliibacter plantistimulans]